MDGGVIELFGDGKQKRDLIYVDDVVSALVGLQVQVARPRARFITSPEEKPISLAELANQLILLTGQGTIESKPSPPERRLIDIGNFYSTSPKDRVRTGLARADFSESGPHPNH